MPRQDAPDDLAESLDLPESLDLVEPLDFVESFGLAESFGRLEPSEDPLVGGEDGVPEPVLGLASLAAGALSAASLLEAFFRASDG